MKINKILFVAIAVTSFQYGFAQSEIKARIAIKEVNKMTVLKAYYPGSYDSRSGTANFICTDNTLLKSFSLSNPAQFVSRFLAADSIADESGKTLCVFLATGPTEDNDCAACAPIMEFLIFHKKSRFWEYISESRGEQLGSMGNIAPFNIKKLGKSIGFLFTGSFTNMGESGETYVLYALVNNAVKRVARLENISYSNEGACNPKKLNNCYSFTGKLNFVETGKNFNDFILSKKGTDKHNGKVIKVDSAFTYRFLNDKYVRVGN